MDFKPFPRKTPFDIQPKITFNPNLLTNKSSDMNDDAKIVIRGVLDKIEDENITEHKASLISRALQKLCGGTWNVITYPTFESEKGYTDSNFRWRDKEWVYAEQTTNTSYNTNEIKTFMDTEFGWATIRDIDKVQQAAYTKINNSFPGTWKVHVAQLKNGHSSILFGATWQSDGFTFFIYRVT